MKNLFNDISQDEKNRILEMHSAKKNVISEQGIQQIPDFGAETQPSPTPKPSPKPTPISLVGKTVNLYRDKDETKIFNNIKIKDVKQGGSFGNNTKFTINYENGAGASLMFKCGESDGTPTNALEYLNREGVAIPVVQMGGGDSSENYLYNSKFVSSLKQQYCTTSSGGSSVPKADFAMNNQSTDTTTGIA